MEHRTAGPRHGRHPVLTKGVALVLTSPGTEMLGSTQQQLPEFTFERRKVKAELLPASAIDLFQQPGPVLLKLLNQRRCILHGVLILVLRLGAVHQLRPQAHPS